MKMKKGNIIVHPKTYAEIKRYDYEGYKLVKENKENKENKDNKKSK